MSWFICAALPWQELCERLTESLPMAPYMCDKVNFEELWVVVVWGESGKGSSMRSGEFICGWKGQMGSYWDKKQVKNEKVTPSAPSWIPPAPPQRDLEEWLIKSIDFMSSGKCAIICIWVEAHRRPEIFIVASLFLSKQNYFRCCNQECRSIQAM